MSERQTDTMPTKELRIGLVLYGGVSLAVYINGVATEIWNALRASRHAALDESKPGGATADVYGELLKELACKGATERLEIVVDTVAGTSAGGISGAALAKSIVDGGDMRELGDTWIRKAGIRKLKVRPRRRLGCRRRMLLNVISCVFPLLGDIRDKIDKLPEITWKWVGDQVYSLATTKTGNDSPLDGDYFTRMIAKTLENMGRSGPTLIGAHQRFDLYLTQTDFHGWRRHLPVSRLFHPEPLYEPAHAHAMSFSSGRCSSNMDFALTYAGRATAGFPVAFSPVNYSGISKAFADGRPDARSPSPEEFVVEHLREHELAECGYEPDHTWMIDGGILDNKPFGLVADAIERKPAARQVYRTVLYVEPDPSRDHVTKACRAPRLKDVAGGLYRLFRHEPIYADLRRHRERNATVVRIREIAAAARPHSVRAAQKVAESCGLAWKPAADLLNDWRSATNDALRRQDDPAYPGYVALKARRSARVLATMVCRELKFPEHSRQAYFVRELMRVWLGKRGWTDPPRFDPTCGAYRFDGQREFLEAFDLPFRLRRLRALVDSANRAYECVDESGRRQLDDFKCRLAEASGCLDRIEQKGQQKISPALKGLLCAEDVDTGIRKLHDGLRLDEGYDCALHETYARATRALSAGCKTVNRRIVCAISAIGDAAIRQRIATDYVVFPFVDRVVFPLMDSAKIEDLIEIDVMRVSPHDTELLKSIRDPLAGAKLGAFAGFLERSSRENDLLWGRLNGADRLVDLITRAAVPDDRTYDEKHMVLLRRRFKIKAMRMVLEDEARRPRTSIGRTRACVEAVLGRAGACTADACTDA